MDISLPRLRLRRLIVSCAKLFYPYYRERMIFFTRFSWKFSSGPFFEKSLDRLAGVGCSIVNVLKTQGGINFQIFQVFFPASCAWYFAEWYFFAHFAWLSVVFIISLPSLLWYLNVVRMYHNAKLQKISPKCKKKSIGFRRSNNEFCNLLIILIFANANFMRK